MSIFPLDFTRYPELVAVNFLRWRRRMACAELENLSDKSLEDIGLAKQSRRDLDTVNPFWMP